MKYYIAILVEGELGHQIEMLRRELANRFGVRQALKSPPHITLHPPFLAQDLDGLNARLRALAAGQTSFGATTNGYGAFREDVWYVNLTQEAAFLPLMRATEEAVASCIQPPPILPIRDPHFHVTLATRDLSPALHRQVGAWLASRPLEPASVVVDHFALLCHVDGRWRVDDLFPFEVTR